MPGGGGSNVDYESSPDQRNMMRMFNPMMAGMMNFGMGQMYPDTTTYAGGSQYPYYYSQFPGLPGQGGHAGDYPGGPMAGQTWGEDDGQQPSQTQDQTQDQTKDPDDPQESPGGGGGDSDADGTGTGTGTGTTGDGTGTTQVLTGGTDYGSTPQMQGDWDNFWGNLPAPSNELHRWGNGYYRVTGEGKVDYFQQGVNGSLPLDSGMSVDDAIGASEQYSPGSFTNALRSSYPDWDYTPPKGTPVTGGPTAMPPTTPGTQPQDPNAPLPGTQPTPPVGGYQDPNAYWQPQPGVDQLWNIDQGTPFGQTATQPGSYADKMMGTQHLYDVRDPLTGQVASPGMVSGPETYGISDQRNQLAQNPFINYMAGFSPDPYTNKMLENPFIPAMQNLDPSGMAATGGKDWRTLAGEAVVPTEAYRKGLDPSISAAIRDPYEKGGDQLFENYLSRGGDNMRGGVSGQTAAGMGTYWADAEKNIAQQEWDMTAPGMQSYQDKLYGLGSGFANQQFGSMLGLGANLGGMAGQMPASQYGTMLGMGAGYGQDWSGMTQQYGQDVTNRDALDAAIRNTMVGGNYSQFLGAQGADWQQDVNKQGAEFGWGQEQSRQQTAQNQYPFTLAPSMIGGAYSTPVISPGTSPWASAAATGAAALPFAFGGTNLASLFG